MRTREYIVFPSLFVTVEMFSPLFLHRRLPYSGQWVPSLSFYDFSTAKDPFFSVIPTAAVSLEKGLPLLAGQSSLNIRASGVLPLLV